MKDFFTNLLSLRAQNLLPEVNLLAAGLWVVVVLCALFSIRSQKTGRKQKAVWMLAVAGLPPVGLLIYCGWCVWRMEFSYFPALSLWRQEKDAMQRNRRRERGVPAKNTGKEKPVAAAGPQAPSSP